MENARPVFHGQEPAHFRVPRGGEEAGHAGLGSLVRPGGNEATQFKVSSLLREIVVKGTTRVSAPPFTIFTRLPVPAVSYIFSYIVSTLQDQLIIYIYIYNLFTGP